MEKQLLQNSVWDWSSQNTSPNCVINHYFRKLAEALEKALDF
jgi:hypothetical protein